METGALPDQGWAWVVMVASFGAHVIHGFFLFGIGILNVAFEEKFKEEVGITSWTSGIFLGLFSVCGLLSGMIVNRWSCRVSMFMGSILMTSGLVLSAFVTSLSYLFLTFGVISGLGAGLCYSSSVVVVGFNFQRHRNVATGIAVSGCGVGAFALAPLMQLSKETYGYSGLCLMCGAAASHHCVFGALFRPSQLEEKSRQLQQIQHKKGASRRSKFVHCLVQSCQVLRNLGFLCIFGSLAFCSTGIYLMYVHFPSLCIQLGTSQMDAAFLLSIAGVCSAASRFLVGVGSNSENINELLLFCGCFSLLGAAGALFPLYASTYGGQVAFATMLGMYSGCCYSLLNSITVKLVGIRELASAYGIEMFGSGIGCFIGPPLAGFLVDAGGTYSQSFMVAGFTVVLGALLGWCVACFDEGKASRTDGHCVDETIIVEEILPQSSAHTENSLVIEEDSEAKTDDVTTELMENSKQLFYY